MSESFLGIEKSWTNRKWVARVYDERAALALSQRFCLPDQVAKALSARGYGLDDAEAFLEPRLRDLMPDPSLFKDMDTAAARFVTAIKNNEKIAVFGDYDVDGATSSALLLRYAAGLGVKLRLYVPDRLSEGYGPNAQAMRTLKGEGVSLVVCVDCGITAHEPLKVAADIGLDVVVVDHHAAEPVLPPAVALVDANRLDDPMGDAFGMLAAVGVTYLFIVAVNRLLRKQNFFSANRKEPDLLALLDLVALGTVCDVVRLTGLNRAYVAQGLKVMGQRQNAGLCALAEAARVKGVFDTYAAGFVMGPRLNAGGRVGQSDLGARLLSSWSEVEAQPIAQKLEAYNEERRAIEAQVLLEAENLIFDEASPITFVASPHWHPGVIGIVASRLKEKYQRPALVVALDGTIGKGSGRSIGNVDLGAAIIAARQAGLLTNGGGHKMAAGFSVLPDKVNDLKVFLAERIGKQLQAEPFESVLALDGLVSPSGMSEDFMKNLKKLAPFGTGNSEPRFALANVRIVRATVVSEKHVSLILSQAGASLRAIAFRAMESDLGPSLLSVREPVHLVGKLRFDEWKNDGSLQLLVEDAAPAL